MKHTRRQFAWTLAAGLAGVSALGFGAARADDDDDGPANVFISPFGQPFRDHVDAPYTVAKWFKQADKNGDGKIDHAEFLADAENFFGILDLNHDGVIGTFEVLFYEHRIAPEVLGARVKVGALAPRTIPGLSGGRLWLAQTDDTMAPDGATPNAPAEPHTLDESNQGASPYSFFQEPEPVTAADFSFRGVIFKKDFLKLADMHFTDLDPNGDGFLTLAKLPQTRAQKTLDEWKRKHRPKPAHP